MSGGSVGNTQMDEIFTLLKSGEASVPQTNVSEVVLFVGNTGAGKSTLTQFLAGDNAKLRSVEVGAGDFLLTDGDRISDTTILSKTIYPELLIDTASNTALYDCPGFNDTRSTCHDIAATYFTKQVVDCATRVKLVLVVNYPSVRKGVDRADFIKLVTHFCKFVRDISKFEDAIALAVTKVDNNWRRVGNRFTLVPDDQIRDNIVAFLSEVRSSLDTISEWDEMDKALAIKLIDILLDAREYDSVPIGLFRRPDIAGSVNNIELLQDGKDGLKKILYGNGSFAEKAEGDFGYTVSELSRNVIFGLAEKINNEITSSMAAVGSEIRNHYCSKMNAIDIEILLEYYERGHSVLSRTVSLAERVSDPMLLHSYIVDSLTELNIDIPREHSSNIVTQSRYLEFCRAVSDTDLPGRPLEWLQPLKDAVTYLGETTNWYRFLVDLHAKLSEYEIQKDPNKYNVVDIEDWGHSEKPQGIEITNSNFRAFGCKVRQNAIESYDYVSGITLETMHLETINKVLNATLKHKISTHFQSGRLVVEGEYVLLSKIAFENYSGVRTLEINALHTVFLDVDLVRVGDRLQASIVAPRWVVVGTRKIVLDGSVGLSHPLDRAPRGQAGKPGLPGGPGGAFLGVGARFVNGKQLTVTANGGAGGPGQHGGNGLDGANGVDPPLPPYNEFSLWSFNPDLVRYITSIKEFRYEEEEGGSSLLIPDFANLIDLFLWIIHILTACGSGITTFTVYGTDGGTSGNGSNGGVGGLGGTRGDITLIELGDASEILLHSVVGSHGAGGQGGTAGCRGENGKTVILEVANSTLLGVPRAVCIRLVGTRHGGYAPSGSPGVDNSNDVDLIAPDQPSASYWRVLNDFKRYARTHLGVHVVKQFLGSVLTRMESNPDLQSFYDTLGLVGDLEGLVEQYNQLRGDVDFLPMYQSLLSRIHVYASNPRTSETTAEYRKVLSYLYTATFAIICRVKGGLDGNLIINICEYLNQAIVNINKLQETGNKIHEINRLGEINKLRENYKFGVDNKITEAQNFIKTQISPKINEIGAQVDEKMAVLINQTLEMQREAEINQKKLRARQIELQDALRFKTILRSVKCIFSVASFLVSVPEGVKGLVELGSLVQETLGLSEHTSGQTRRPLVIPESVSTLSAKATAAASVIQELGAEQLADQNELDAIASAVHDAQAKVTKLREIEAGIRQRLEPMLQSMAQCFRDLENRLPSQSGAGLEISKWQVQSTLRDVKRQMQQLTRQIDGHEDLAHVLEHLDEAMTCLVNVYDRLQTYGDMKKEADYIADLSSAGSSAILVVNPELANAVARLEQLIQSSLIVRQYDSAVNGFRQWVFPYAQNYLPRLALPEELQGADDTQSLAESKANHIREMRAWLGEYLSTVSSSDQYQHHSEFRSDYNFAQPFFTWTNARFPQTIRRLLAGEVVVIKANVANGPSKKHAIKFRELSINVKVSDESVQQQINHALKHFKLHLTHHGNSYYRFGNDLFVISSRQQTITQSFEKKTNGHPVEMNEVYKKIRDGDLMLSPYAMWSIQIVNPGSGDFAALQNYGGGADLELVGCGGFVSEDARHLVSSDMLKTYYAVEGTVSFA